MALFSNDKKTAKAKKVKSTTRNWGRGILPADDARLANVLKRPWFSEKALVFVDTRSAALAVYREGLSGPRLERFASELVKKNELEYDEIEAIFVEYGKQRVVPPTAPNPT